MNLDFFLAIRKSFLCEMGGMASFGNETSEGSQSFSLKKSYFPPIHASFLPQNFPTIQYLASFPSSYSAK